jgi:signal transduction histidine kinase
VFPLRLRHLLLAVIVVTMGSAALLSWVRAVVVMREHSDAQARSQVEAAALLARASIERAGSELVSTARLLAERPTLQRFVQDEDAAALTAFLERFARTGELRACMVVRDGQIWASSATELPASMIAAVRGGDAGAWRILSSEETLLLGALERVEGSEGLEVIVFEDLPRLGAGMTSIELPLSSEVIEHDRAARAFDDPRALLWGRALDDTSAHVDRLREGDRFVAAVPLLDATGAMAGVISTSLDAAAVDAPRRALGLRLLRDLLVVGVLGGIALWWIGRRVSRSLESLTRGAARIGEGDLDSPVPRDRVTLETLGLGRAMEEMRGRILELTTQLRRERTETEGVLRGMADGVFAVDRERRIQYLSPQTATLLGIEPDQAIGRFCGDVLDPVAVNGERPCATQCPILEARSQGSARRTESLRVRGDHALRTVLITSTADPLDGPDASGVRQVQVIRDETDVEAARRLRDNVVANVSHEFRTPLSAQLASLEMLLEKIPDTSREELLPLLHSIERGTLRLTRLVDNLLESLSIDAGRATLRRQQVEIGEVCQEAIDATLPLLVQKDQRIALQCPDDLPALTGDRVRLVQVFVNLLANANKFAPAGASIVVRAHARAETIEVEVDDDGPGLPEGADERLFDRFVRASGEQPGESGLGLGLWLVRSIVERHGGHVVARRLQPGTRFAVSLPRTAA